MLASTGLGVVRDCALGMRAATESRLRPPLRDSQTWVWTYRNETGWCWPVLDWTWSAIGDARRSNDRVCIICDCALGMRAATNSRLKPVQTSILAPRPVRNQSNQSNQSSPDWPGRGPLGVFKEQVALAFSLSHSIVRVSYRLHRYNQQSITVLHLSSPTSWRSDCHT